MLCDCASRSLLQRQNSNSRVKSLPKAGHSSHHQTITGERSCFIKTANLHFPGKWYPEGLCAKYICGAEKADVNKPPLL